MKPYSNLSQLVSLATYPFRDTHSPVLDNKKTLHNERACISLIFQAQPTGISTVSSTHMDNGCRGFIGPVPPPLWMSSYFVVRSVEHEYMIH